MSIQQERNEDLKQTVEVLIDELEEERARSRRLERALAESQREAEKWRHDHEMRHKAASKWNDNIEDRIELLETKNANIRAEDIIGAGPAESLIPIQQMYNACKNGAGDTLKPNQRRAAMIWPHYRKYCDPSGGKLTLTSSKVVDILTDELGIDDTHPNTVKRVMKNLAKFSGKDEESRFIEFDDEKKVNRLQCDREDWVEVTEEMLDAAGGSRQQMAATDGGQEGW